ncbi:MAG: mechanosensitive ion channel family protein [Deltaproteobacteria bacterium]|nr:mechanosensitive ion channel family protein [Deltaproteobacteria bacterium]
MRIEWITLACAIALLLYFRWAGRVWKRLPQLPLGFFIVWLLLESVAPLLTRLAWHGLLAWVAALATIALYFGLIRFAAFAIESVVGKRRRVAVPGIVRDVVLVILYVIVILVVLRQQLHLDLTSLVATSAVLTAVLGLALQETLGNLFSGIALNVERPYKLGDWVAFDKYRGQVREMGWRSTTILTAENEAITIPNNLISRSTIVNYSDPSTLIVSGFFLGIGYEIPPNRVRATVLELLRAHPQVHGGSEMEVRVVDFGESAVRYEVRYFVDIREGYECTEHIKSELLTHCWYRFQRDGLRIPYPTRINYQGREPTPEALGAEIGRVLANVEVFSPLQADDRRLLAARVDQLYFARGETVVHQGAAGDCMYVIAKGGCEIVVSSPGRQSVVVARMGPGEFFGEMSLMTGEPRSATVVATDDLMVYAIDKEDMLAVLEAHPTLSAAISEILALRLAQRTEALASAGPAEPHTLPPNAGQILQRIRSFFGIR